MIILVLLFLRLQWVFLLSLVDVVAKDDDDDDDDDDDGYQLSF